jgi:hypothetical protein
MPPLVARITGMYHYTQPADRAGASIMFGLELQSSQSLPLAYLGLQMYTTISNPIFFF